VLYPKDPRIQVQRRERTIRIEWRWKNENGAGALMMFAFFVIITVGVIFSPEKPGQEMSPTGHLGFNIAMGICLLASLIFGLGCWFNKTIVHGDHERLIVKASPFLWFKPVIIPAKTVEQFFISRSPLGSRRSQTLFLLFDDSRSQAIGHYFPSTFAAYQVCHELQDWFELEDLPVFGHTSLPHQPGPRSR
jgi:hypothetical protein